MKTLKLQFALAAVASLCLANIARADSFTLSPGSPTLPGIPATPADVLADPVPVVSYPAPALGLAPGDVVDAISNGFDPVPFPHTDYFSVTPGSVGAPGSGVAAEFAADTAPGVSPGHASDIFVSSPALAGTNILAPVGFGWTGGTTTGDEANTGLINPGDNVNAYDLTTIPMGAPIYFSLAAGSPSLAGLGATPDDVLAVGGAFGAVPVVFIDGVLGLGLPPGTDLDALALFAPGGVFLGPGTIEFSLTGATAPPVAASLGSGATILGLAPGLVPVHPFFTLGLLLGDDIDALDVDQFIIVPEPAGLSLLAFGALGLILFRRRPQA